MDVGRGIGVDVDVGRGVAVDTGAIVWVGDGTLASIGVGMTCVDTGGVIVTATKGDSAALVLRSVTIMASTVASIADLTSCVAFTLAWTVASRSGVAEVGFPVACPPIHPVAINSRNTTTIGKATL